MYEKRTKRALSPKEIEDILSFIEPPAMIPADSARCFVDNNRELLRKQLQNQYIYPELIPELRNQMEKHYHSSLVQPGESVGIICAQSIGEKQTQSTLNSIDWKDQILYTRDGTAIVEPIGQMIDRTISQTKAKDITNIPENRTQYVELPEGFKIPAPDEHGNVKWYKIEAVTRHLPVGKLVKVTTESGRYVTATQSKSFLVWNGDIFEGVNGSDIKVGDIMPTTTSLVKPDVTQEFFDMESIFPKTEYVYTREVIKAREFRAQETTRWWFNHAGKDFIVPYKRGDTMFGRRKDYYLTCEPGLIHPAFGVLGSRIPDRIKLDVEFGFVIGVWLAEGFLNNTELGFSNNDDTIKQRIINFFVKYDVKYVSYSEERHGDDKINGTSMGIRFRSALMSRLFKAICKTGAHNKHLPEFAYTAPTEFIKGLLDGYYSGDGSVSKDGNITVTSVSEDLILGVSFLLSYFGIFGRLASYQSLKSNTHCENIKRTFTLYVANGYAQQFAKEILLTESKKQERLHTITLARDYRFQRGRAQLRFPHDRDVCFDKVVSVEYVEGTTEFVYDLTVEKTRNFCLRHGLGQNDTFHSTGTTDKTTTVGVPRFQELLNATKDPRMVNCKIYFKRNNGSIQEIRERISRKIVGLTLGHVTLRGMVEIDKPRDSWYPAFEILGGDLIRYKDAVRYDLDTDKLFEYRIRPDEIGACIEREYADLQCVHSPVQHGKLDVFADTSDISLSDERASYRGTQDANVVYLEEVVKPMLDKIVICGIPGIHNIYYAQEGDEWFVESDGSSFLKLLGLEDVDETRTVSNNVWDIYNVLGIEAAREFLIEEFTSIMEGINICHAQLLVEKMTFLGTISSISRYTLRREEAGPCSRASFEETLDNFLKAAAFGEREYTRGVSASIICGKRSNIGTGMMELIVDVGMLNNMKPTILDDVIEAPNRPRLATIRHVGETDDISGLEEQMAAVTIAKPSTPLDESEESETEDEDAIPAGYFSD